MRTLVENSLRYLAIAVVVIVCSHCVHHEAPSGAAGDARLEEYRAGFAQLVENDLRGLHTSKPELHIYTVTETPSELSIRYDLHYVETAADGESIQRSSSGVALLKRKNKTNPDWFLYKIRDAEQTMSFAKGATVTL